MVPSLTPTTNPLRKWGSRMHCPRPTSRLVLPPGEYDSRSNVAICQLANLRKFPFYILSIFSSSISLLLRLQPFQFECKYHCYWNCRKYILAYRPALSIFLRTLSSLLLQFLSRTTHAIQQSLLFMFHHAMWCDLQASDVQLDRVSMCSLHKLLKLKLVRRSFYRLRLQDWPLFSPVS